VRKNRQILQPNFFCSNLKIWRFWGAEKPPKSAVESGSADETFQNVNKPENIQNKPKSRETLEERF
jgi:hypothetical protein